MKKKLKTNMGTAPLAVFLCAVDGCSDFVFSRFVHLL